MAKNPFKELGSIGRNQWGSMVMVTENPELTGLRGVRTFNDMLYDPTGSLMYQALALPVRTVPWMVQPGGITDVDIEAAAFTWDCFQKVAGGWLGLLSNVASMFWAGWSYFEMVMGRRDDGRVGFSKIAPRPQQTLLDWRYASDGDILGMEQQLPDGMAFVPLKRSLLFRTTSEGDVPEGVSIFRAAHRTWQYKHRLEQVEGIGLQRRWAGFPIVTMPAAATTIAADSSNSDEAKADTMIEGIYNDRMMGVKLPDGWALDFGGPEGNVDTTMGDTIMRKDMEMARAILAQFLLLGMRNVGTQALAKALSETFSLAVEAFLNSIADEFNMYAIPYLFRYNIFEGLTALPTLIHAPAQALDLQKLASFIDALTKAGVSVADEPTVDFLRSLVPGMPPLPAEAAESEKPAEEKGTQEQREIDNATMGRGATFAQGGFDLLRLDAITAANREAQTATVERLGSDVGSGLAALPETATEVDARRIIDDLVLAALLLFRERSVADIAAAFWLGYGKPSGGGEVLPLLQQETAVADSWIGYGSGGQLLRVNPAGKATLFGDIAGQLEGQIAAILLLLKQGRREEVFGLVADAMGAATRGGVRPGLYGGNVWHAGWKGAVERERYSPDPVRWRVDPLALHCPTCAKFGDRVYPTMAALLSLTGGVLPGYGTECDGGCRCTLEMLRGGVWSPL